MKNRMKREIAVLLVAGMIGSLTACGSSDAASSSGSASGSETGASTEAASEEEQVDGYTTQTEDGAYELSIDSDWKLTITNLSDGTEIADGSLDFRDEDGSLTVSVDDEILNDDTEATVFGEEITDEIYFTYGDTEFTLFYTNPDVNAENLVFVCEKGPMLNAIGAAGSVYTASDDEHYELAMFSWNRELVFWNNGKLELKFLIVQASMSYEYSEENGLTISQTDDEKKIVTVELETTEDGNYIFNYSNLSAELPEAVGDQGTDGVNGSIPIDKEELENALKIAGVI